jgi:hypothetical protein
LADLKRQNRALKRTLAVVLLVGGVLLVASFLVTASLLRKRLAEPERLVASRMEENNAASSVMVVPSLSVAYEEIRKTADAMTKAELKAYEQALKGKKIRWSGYVEEVHHTLAGGYDLYVDMDAPDVATSVYDVAFQIPERVALTLEKDQPVTFSGEIRSIVDVLGSLRIRLVDARIETGA